MNKIQNFQKITQEIVSNILAVNLNTQQIILYGSCARGDNTMNSDIDIMVVLNCGEQEIKKYRTQISKTLSRISLEYDVLISVAVRDALNFVKRQEYVPFYKNVAKEGIRLYGHAA